MNDEIKQVQDRLRKIEDDLVAERATRTANRRWATFAGLVLITWLGYTSFYQIPKAVDQSSTGRVAHEAEQARDRAVKAAAQLSSLAAEPLVRPEQGVISIPAGPGTPLRDRNGPRKVTGTVEFKSPYTKFVDIHCALRSADIVGGTRYKIETKAKEDRTGFDWSFEVWADTRFWQCQIDWLALGQ
jgi:hypothetical protein